MKNKIFKDIPQFAIDERQRLFFKSLDKFQDINPDHVSYSKISGYPASYVNIGYIKDQIKEYILDHKNISDDNLRSLLQKELPLICQRLKYISVDNIEHLYDDKKNKNIRITMKTKDDHGWYTYIFEVRGAIY